MVNKESTLPGQSRKLALNNFVQGHQNAVDRELALFALDLILSLYSHHFKDTLIEQSPYGPLILYFIAH